VGRPEDERKIPHGEHVALATFWMATNFVLGALLVIVIQSQIRDMVGVQRSATVLGTVIGAGALPAILVPLIVGPFSDRCFSRLGRRRPYILAGTLIYIAGLGAMFGMSLLGNPWLYLGAYVLMQIGANTAMAAYSGIIPDMVPHHQRGIASGYMAVMSQVGTLLGILTASFIPHRNGFFSVYLVLAMMLGVGLLVTMSRIKETPLTEKPPKLHFGEYFRGLWIDPRKHPDFAWVWITRAFVMLGFYTVQPFLQYYFADVIGVRSPEKTAGWVSALVMVGATLSGYFGGALSDQVGRKRIVYLANSFMAVMCVAFAVLTTLEWVVGAAILFGIGYGAYISVDWALGTDVLPNKDDAAKDMAVWHVSMTLPQAIAAIPAGYLIAIFGVTEKVNREGIVEHHYTHAGFAALFLCAGLCLGLGAILLRNVKSVS
jgi:MFS family permease